MNSCSVQKSDGFATFIQCWCQHVSSSSLTESEKRKRAYYWAWQADDWYPTLQYLANDAEPLQQQWWLLDPTPFDAEQVQVSRIVWAEDLDPQHQPWTQYEPVCSVPDTLSALEMSDVLGLPRPLDVTPATTECFICNEEALAEVHNPLLQHFAQFRGQDALEPSVSRYQQQYSDLTQYPGWQLVYSLVKQTALPFDQVAAVASAFIRRPLEEWQDDNGLILRLECGHTFHSECVRQWSAMSGHRRESAVYFEPLKGLYSQDDSARLDPSQLQPFSCPICRKLITHVQVLGEEKDPIALVHYSTDPVDAEASEWGPYRLKKDALVWAYTKSLQFGGEYAGGIGFLRAVVPPMADLACAFGGCFRVEMILPPMGMVEFPVGTVFDFSFFELDLIPTRDQVQKHYAVPLAQFEARVGFPNLVTCSLGYGDFLSNWNGFFPNPRVREACEAAFAKLQNTLTPTFWSQLQKHIATHRNETESALVRHRRQTRPDWRLTQDKILHSTGYYRHQPSPDVHLPDVPNSELHRVARLMSQDPDCNHLPVNFMQMIQFISFALGGYDFLPRYSPVLLPALRKILPEVSPILLSLETGPIRLLSEPTVPASGAKRASSSSSSTQPAKSKRR